MELDELKQAWLSMDRRLERQESLQLGVYRDAKLGTLRQRLRPLVWGQAMQVLFGVLVVMMSAAFWRSHWQEMPMLIAGVVMHVYGVAAIIMGGITLARISRIDYSAPVLTMQKQLASVRRLHVLGGMLVGLPWWVLWLPVLLMIFKAAFGVDLFPSLQSWFWINTAVGAVGLAATWGFHRWSQHPNRPRLAKLVDDSMTGSSLRKAQGVLDEIAQFERE